MNCINLQNYPELSVKRDTYNYYNIMTQCIILYVTPMFLQLYIIHHMYTSMLYLHVIMHYNIQLYSHRKHDA